MIEAARLGVYVTAEGVDETRKKVGGLGDAFSGIAGKMTMAGGVMSAAVTAPLLMLGNRAVDAASDVVENMNKVDVVFGTSAGAVEAFASTAAANLGISEGAALGAAGTFGNMFDAMGLGKQVAAGMSTDVLQLAADLGSFNNVDPSEMLQKLRSGLVGEAEPLRSMGILLTEATVKAQAMKMGLGDANGALTEGEKVQARYALIVAQSKNAMGDFARTADGNANATRILDASMTDLTATIGMQLLPIKLQLVQVIQQVVTWFQQLNPSTQGLVVIFGVVAAAIGPLLVVLGTLAGAVAAIGLPVVALIAGLGLLAAAFATNWGGVRDTVMGAIQPVIDAVKTAVGVFQTLSGAGQTTVQSLVGAFAGFLGSLVGFQQASEIMQTLRSALAPIADAIMQVVNAATNAIAVFTTLRDSGQSVFQALAGAITVFVGSFIGFQQASELVQKIREAWQKLVEFFEPTIERIRAAVGPMVESFSPLGEKIAAVWAIVEPVLSALANIIGTVVVVAFNLLLEIVAAVMPSIGTIIGNAIDIATTVLETLSTVVTEVVGLVTDLINGDFTGAWEHVQTILDTLKEAVVTIFGKIADTILTVIKDLITAFTNWYNSLSKNSEFVRNTLTPALQSLANLISGAVTSAVNTATGVFNGLKGAIESIGGAINSVIGWLDNLKNRLGSLKLPAWLTPGSPTPFEYGLLGINEALLSVSAQGLPEMAEAMSALGDAVDSVLGIFSGIQNITVIGDLASRMKTFKDQVVAIIRELADLAGMLAGMPEGANWASAKAGLDAVVSVMEPLLTSLDTITGVGDMKILTDIPERIAFIKAAFLALIRGVAEMTNSPEMVGLTAATATGLGLSAFGKAIEGVFGPLREAAKAWETIKGFDFTGMKVEPVLRWLASFGAMAVQAVEWARSWAGTAGEGMGAFIAGVGTAVKSLADVAKAWETIQKFNWSALDAGAVVKWLASLGGLAVEAMNWASAWATPGAGLDAFAAAVKTSLGGLVEVAKAWEVLTTFKWNAGLDMKKVVEWLAALGGLAVTALQNVAKWEQFETIDAKVKDLAAYMQSAFGALSAAVQFTNELDGWKDLPDLEGKFDRLRRAIEYIVPQFELTRKAVGELAYEEVGKFAQALVDVASGIQAALSLMQTDMSNLDVPDATFWEPLNEWIKQTMTSFSNWLAANPNLTEQSPMVTAFGQAIGGLFGGLRSAIEVAAMLPKDWAAPSDAVWTPFTDWVKRTFESFYDYVTQVLVLDPRSNHPTETPRFTIGGLDLVGKFGAALSGLFGGLKTALELAFNLPASWTAPDASAWGSFVSWVQKVFDSFLAWVTKTHTDANGNAIPFDTVGLDLVNKFGGALSSLMGGLSSSFAVFSGLIGFVAPSQTQLNNFANAVKVVFESFATYAETTLVVSANAAVKAFGDAMGSLFGGLNTALTFTSAVYKEAPGFFAFLASATTTGGDFQVKMGLINTAITETMSRFKTNVVDKVKTDWLPSANALLSAVQSVFGVLNTALGIFKDLNTVGMPDSKTITGFIDAVVSLFTKLTTQLGLVPGQVGGSLATAKTLITDPTTLQRYSEAGTSLGQSTVGGLKWGMSNDWAKTTLDTGVGVMVSAITTSFEGKMGIHSPSKVFMGYGQQLAAGLGLGLNQGMQDMGLPGMNGQLQLAYAGLPTQTVRVQVGGDISIGGQKVTPEMADEIAYLLTQRLRLRG